ncbi:MAG: SDR family NAD(P)-dependent oxidoreductase, partial [Nitrospinae bacterium]|nr:SDR family NAD(P)-dependent oxidoreductase [Nitrospinota bacterium]
MLKRIFDILISLTGLILLLPLFAVLAILIKLDSGGSVFFRQERVGKGGKKFSIYKFRTLFEGSEDKGPKITTKNDPRLTPAGRIMRRLRLDELPQLINVLTGEMSIIGPKPEIPSIVMLYTEKDRNILSVLPGIISPTELLGRSEFRKFPEKVDDVEEYYIKFILPEKLSIDLDYVNDNKPFRDLRYLLSGVKTLIADSVGKKIKINGDNKKRILIIGTGDAGELILKGLLKNAEKYRVIGFVDNDPKKFGAAIHGIEVLGRIYDIPQLTIKNKIDEIIIARPDLSSKNLRAIIEFCKKGNVRYKLVSAVEDLKSGKVNISAIKNVDVADLLGRETVKLDISAISGFIKDKGILVTGAGGSIGSELCRQIIQFQPAALTLLDKNENYLHEIETELSDYGNTSFYLCDITDEKDMDAIFKRHLPQIVFHAAAYKHVPMMERHKEKAVINNVYGTKMLADLSDRFGVNEFVLVSTDKAVRPVSVMGATKRVAELYVQSLVSGSKTRFVTVRFGNVLNSRGSVIPTFLRQIETGGPITITHSEARRYFMTIPEAAQLILQSAVMGESGDILILDMGKPVKIVDMAKELLKLHGLKAGRDIEIKFTGLRPGEKLFEELTVNGEALLPTYHGKIKVIKPKGNNFEVMNGKIEELYRAALETKTSELLDKLKEM